MATRYSAGQRHTIQRFRAIAVQVQDLSYKAYCAIRKMMMVAIHQTRVVIIQPATTSMEARTATTIQAIQTTAAATQAVRTTLARVTRAQWPPRGFKYCGQ